MKINPTTYLKWGVQLTSFTTYVNNNPESIARALITSWMNSPGHRANILSTRYSNLGVGTDYDGRLHYYSTQNFW